VGVAVIAEQRETEAIAVGLPETLDAAVDLHQRGDGPVQAALVADDVDVQQITEKPRLLPRSPQQHGEQLVQGGGQRRLGILVAARHPQVAVTQEVEPLIARERPRQALADRVLDDAGQAGLLQAVAPGIVVLHLVARQRPGAQGARPGVVGGAGERGDQIAVAEAAEGARRPARSNAWRDSPSTASTTSTDPTRRRPASGWRPGSCRRRRRSPAPAARCWQRWQRLLTGSGSLEQQRSVDEHPALLSPLGEAWRP
jgi:hypothetical protein